MFLFEVVAAGLLLSLLMGGSLRALADEPLRGELLLLTLLPVQLAWPMVVNRFNIDCALSIVVWLFVMTALAVVLFVNAPRRWMLAFAGLGIACNILVIGLNGAMPVSVRATSEIGSTRAEARAALEDACLHEPLNETTLLPFLADVVPIPGPAWQRGVVSVGDMLLALGLGAWVFVAARRPGRIAFL